MAGFAAIYVIWGSTYLAIRVAVQTMPPLLMAGGRFIVAGLILWAILASLNRFHATGKQWRDNSILGAFMLLGGNGLVVWAEQTIPSGIATLIISLNPIFIVVAEWFIASTLFQRWRNHGVQRSSARTDAHANSGASLQADSQPRGSARPTWLTVVGLVLGLLGLGILVGPALGLRMLRSWHRFECWHW